eukprot:1159590-Pelagomonas_calceolata.AAC.6
MLALSTHARALACTHARTHTHTHTHIHTHTHYNVLSPPVVSDAGSGGQVLLDEPTFQRIKDRLFELGAVDCNGMNYKRLRSIKTRKQVKRGLEWLSFEWLYNKTWQGGQSSHDLMEGSPLHPAVVFDM